MLPYFEQPLIRVGPVTIHAFSVLLLAAIILGRWIVLRRARRLGIAADSMAFLCTTMLLCGLAGAHLVKTILPDIPGFLADPALVLYRTHGIASLGGLGGGLLGGVLLCRIRGCSNAQTLLRLDIIAYALPFAWTLGRLGCALAHDHRGIPSTVWLAVRFPEGPRYDLGLIEFLFLIALSALFYFLDRRPRPAGFFFGLYGVIYGLFRVWLDTLHIQPLRFLGGATACVVGLAGWAALVYFNPRKEKAPLEVPCAQLSS
jgi:phosphatidylglycerol:prolipoprotein diacylglycerol transferase